MEPLNQYFDIHSREHFISCHQICICHNQYVLVCHFNVHIVPVWIAIILVFVFFSLSLSFFFWFSPQQLTLSTVNSASVHCSRSHKLPFSATFLLKMGLTALFTHLKIISLQCFQFQFSILAKISSIQTYPYI